MKSRRWAKQRRSADHRACCGHAHGDHARRDDVAHARSDGHPQTMEAAIQGQMKKSLRGRALDGCGVQEHGGTSAPTHVSMAKASAGRLTAYRSCATAGTHGASQASPAHPHRTPSAALQGCRARTSTIRTAGTARPSLAACGTSLGRGSTRSTSAIPCRCSPMRSRAGRSMRGARAGARGSQGSETVPVLATGIISWVRMEEEGVIQVRARAGMYPLLRDSARGEGVEKPGVCEEYWQALG